MQNVSYNIDTNVIISDSNYNTANNPIAMLFHGPNSVSRLLVRMDISDILEKYTSGAYAQLDKITHTLHFVNTGIFESYDELSDFPAGKVDGMTRDVDFDLVAFEIPDFKVGSGYEYPHHANKSTLISESASNWFNADEELTWIGGLIDEEKIIGTYHIHRFEDLLIDLTSLIQERIETMNPIVSLAVRFDKEVSTETTEQKYVGFFTRHCHTIFQPKLISNYDVHIDDCRGRVIAEEGYVNKLYFYHKKQRKLVNLDEIPTCTINGVEYEVKQEGIGIYSIELELDETPSYDMECEDVWHVKYNGIDKDIKQFFVIKSDNWAAKETPSYVPALKGIRPGQVLVKGDIHRLTLISKILYTPYQNYPEIDAYYTLYQQVDDHVATVINYEKFDRWDYEVSTIIDTNELLPGSYHMDIIYQDGEYRSTFKNKLYFTIEEK